MNTKKNDSVLLDLDQRMIQSSEKLSVYGQEVVCVISALLTVLGCLFPWMAIPSLAICVIQYI